MTSRPNLVSQYANKWISTWKLASFWKLTSLISPGHHLATGGSAATFGPSGAVRSRWCSTPSRASVSSEHRCQEEVWNGRLHQQVENSVVPEMVQEDCFFHGLRVFDSSRKIHIGYPQMLWAYDFSRTVFKNVGRLHEMFEARFIKAISKWSSNSFIKIEIFF